MSTIADYIVIRDGTFELATGESRNFGSIFIPSDRVPGTAKAKAILQYKARPLSNPPFAATTELTVQFNGTTVQGIKLTLDTIHGLWETFPATILNADSSANFVQFRAEIGPVRIADIILWFQRRI
jgi:hypothetical protein